MNIIAIINHSFFFCIWETVISSVWFTLEKTPQTHNPFLKMKLKVIHACSCLHTSCLRFYIWEWTSSHKYIDVGSNAGCTRWSKEELYLTIWLVIALQGDSLQSRTNSTESPVCSKKGKKVIFAAACTIRSQTAFAVQSTGLAGRSQKIWKIEQMKINK